MADYLVTRKGQVTIPKELRDKYNLGEGSVVSFEDAGGCIVMRKAIGFLDLVGLGQGKSTPEEMNRLLEDLRKRDD